MLRSATVFIIASIGLASPSDALLSERNLFAPGDGLVTRDSSSGLDWLDLTETQGFSMDQVLAGEGGFIDEGWRAATGIEFCGLVTEYVGPWEGCTTVAFSAASQYVEPSQVAGALDLVSLLGPTYQDASLWSFTGWLDDGDLGDGEADVGTVSWYTDGSASWVNYGAIVGTDDWNTDQTLPNRGTYLVRAIPEPATALLMGLGLAAIAATSACRSPRPPSRRRRAAS